MALGRGGDELRERQWRRRINQWRPVVRACANQEDIIAAAVKDRSASPRPGIIAPSSLRQGEVGSIVRTGEAGEGGRSVSGGGQGHPDDPD
jgi:hypothetical protein